METRRLGRTEMDVSKLGFGAAEIGLQNVSFSHADRLLNTVVDAGINVIDTAECYNGSEELIGKSISHRRKEIFLFTKCGHASGLDGENWDVKTMACGIERSLKRLNVDHVDLIQLHSCPLPLLQQGDVIDVLEKARDCGKTRYIGCSADGKAAAYAIETGRFDVLQTSFSLADQEPLSLTLPLARKFDMGVIAKRPIANAVWRFPERPDDPWLHTYWDRMKELDYPFLSDTMDHTVAMALQFALYPEEIATAIVGTTNPTHLLNNIQLLEKKQLGKDEFDEIRLRWKECGGDSWPGKG